MTDGGSAGMRRAVLSAGTAAEPMHGMQHKLKDDQTISSVVPYLGYSVERSVKMGILLK